MRHIDTYCILEDRIDNITTNALTAKCRLYLESNINMIREEYGKDDKKFGCVVVFNNETTVFIPDDFANVIKQVTKKWDCIEAAVRLAKEN